MADKPDQHDDVDDDDPVVYVSYKMAELFVNWKQAAPSPSEVVALRRIDPAFRDKSLIDVAAVLKDADWWQLGPFSTEEEADVIEGQLRSAGFTVQKKWE